MRHLFSSDTGSGVSKSFVAAEILVQCPAGVLNSRRVARKSARPAALSHSRPPEPSPLDTATACPRRVGHPRDHSGLFLHLTSAIKVMNVTKPPHPALNPLIVTEREHGMVPAWINGEAR